MLRPNLCGSFLEATIVDSAGQEWVVAAAHLCAGATEADESRREADLVDLLDVFSQRRSQRQPHIIAGDFNSNAPSQKIDPGRCKPPTQQERAQNGGEIPRRVVQKMLDAGYVDAFAQVAPETAAITGTFSTQFSGQRVDYTFTHGFGAQQLRTAWVEQDRLAKYCSDHFPIGVEINAGDSH
jgi:endonuclease/exonuclease/phosphatase family metal-dependent hydrolase